MVNGTAVLLAVTALILLVLLFMRRCDSHQPPEPMTTQAEGNTVIESLQTEPQQPIKTKNSKKNRKKGRKEHQPISYPERSPLDEPVAN